VFPWYKIGIGCIIDRTDYPREFIMNTLQQTVTIPQDRHLRLDFILPESIPSGKAEMLLVLSPAHETRDKPPIRHLAGCLADSAAFADDPLALQKIMRDEWQ
jgi:hypothetical protein